MNVTSRPGTRTAALLLAALLAAGAGLTACGDDTDKTTPPGKGETTTSAPATGATTTATGAATAPADEAAARAQVKQNFEKFFSPSTDLTAKAALLQNGEQMLPVLQGFAQDPRVGQVQAAVDKVAFTSPTAADVTYALSLQGTVVAPDAAGKAVLENGTWKVSTATLCGLLAQSGATAVPGCG
ncbi:hypothetical protein ACIA8O_03820 [Kitasatospora sp. NPDC051853]|uniref:hypothetical protein n=1 Tax=Kitasatospora sp. NPDC051853 TaxID=3364058 RepID=UPI0037AE66B1